MRAWTSGLLLVIVLLGWRYEPQKLLAVEAHGELVVVTYNGPLTYYYNGEDKPTGPEYDAVQLFAAYLSQQLHHTVRARFLVVAHPRDVIPTLLAGKAHMAAAALVVGAQPPWGGVQWGKPYQEVRQQVVYDRQRVVDWGHDSSVFMAGAGVLTPETRRRLARAMPSVPWIENAEFSSLDMLSQVAEGLVNATIADSRLVALEQQYYPGLAVAFDVGVPQPVAWGFPPFRDDGIYRHAQRFIEQAQQNGSLQQIHERYWGYAHRLHALDAPTFVLRVQQKLPQHRLYFQQAGVVTGLDWKLLAAISYQESLWDADAHGAGNVMGLMMLTETTADALARIFHHPLPQPKSTCIDVPARPAGCVPA